LNCVEISRRISEEERAVGHRRTVIVGDLNMNPFEKGVAGANGLHAVMTRTVALAGERTVQERSYPFFYNPMWGHFGDRLPGPPGSYYYQGSELVTYFWNIFDQVLVRPELLDRFRDEDVRILESAGAVPLISTRGRPDEKAASDHLPILFKLEL
jgi:hypothetical protein